MGGADPSRRRRDDDGAWPVVGQPLTHARREQVHAALAEAARLLDRPPPVAAELADAGRALAELGAAWQDATDALVFSVDRARGEPLPRAAEARTAGTGLPGDAGPATLMALVELVREVKAAEDGVREDRSRLSAGTGDVVRQALGELRGARSLADLVRGAPAAAAAIGFDRVLLSRIEESAWIPEAMYVGDDARWAEEILEAGREDLRTLDHSLLETQIVRRNRPLVVGDTDRPDLHRALIEVTRSRSYAAAPIVGWGRVVGFLHADCYRQRRQLDRSDRDLLWMFCDGLGHLVVATAATDTLSSLRTELGRLLSGTDPGGGTPPVDGRHLRASVSGWPGTGAPPGIAASTTGAMPATGATPATGAMPTMTGAAPGVAGELTRRELEVMRLMGAGHTNARIARRLVISEGTVKSHVKHILRKLGAANRAEAVARWLREEHARAAGHDGLPRRVGA